MNESTGGGKVDQKKGPLSAFVLGERGGREGRREFLECFLLPLSLTLSLSIPPYLPFKVRSLQLSLAFSSWADRAEGDFAKFGPIERSLLLSSKQIGLEL